MAYRIPDLAPESRIPADRRGPVGGRFCKSCQQLYPLHRGRHVGKPLYGKDHVASPCSEEGETFGPGADWWEPAVEMLPAPASAAPVA
jgi:hypothetical protein